MQKMQHKILWKNLNIEKVIKIETISCLDVVFIIILLACVVYLFLIRDDYTVSREERLRLIKVFQNYKSWKR